MPSKPLNLTVVGVNGTSIRLSWIAPEHSNGAIQGYWIYYVYQNETLFKPCLKNDAATGTKIFYNLTNLRKDIMTKTVIKTVITFKKFLPQVLTLSTRSTCRRTRGRTTATTRTLSYSERTLWRRVPRRSLT